MHPWTDAQLQAIQARNRSVLVSAAAGSGKTSVLIERLMDLLRKGASLDRMLVVTFTRAAAAEMKERLARSLQEEARRDKHLRKQYQLLSSADIGTLHSFCKKLIERHFQAISADPGSAIADEGRLKALFDRALSEEMEALYEAPDADGQHLIDQYGDRDIEELVRELYRFLMAQAHPWAWLQQQMDPPDGDPAAQPWYQVAVLEAISRANAAKDLADAALALTQRPDGPRRYELTALADREMAVLLLESLEAARRLPPGTDPKYLELSRAKAPPEEDPALNQRYKDIREAFKKQIGQCVDALPRDDKALQKAQADIAWTLPALRALGALTRKVHEHYALLKQERQMLDYNDLEHMALAALQDERVRRDVREQYDALFVDEYQDISRIQDAIIQGLHGEQGSLFMVGDVKQSIYRFRLADPGLFMEKYDRFEPDEDAGERVILLSENFRSRPNILHAVNHVFHHTLRGDALEIDYDERAALQPGLPAEQDPAVELHLILPREQGEEEDEDGEQLDATQREAALIAERVEQLLKQTVTEKGRTRNLQFRDMVILLRSASSRAAKMADILKARGIPVYSDADSQYFDVQEVDDTLNLLQVLDNPLQDEKLLAALAAPPFDWTPAEMAELRLQAESTKEPLHRVFFRLAQQPGRAKDAADTLARWRFLAQNTPLDSFLRDLLEETGAYMLAGAKPQGELRRANLRLLCERAGPDPQPQTLQGFLSRVHEARKQDNTKAAATLGAQENVLRIMTIHKSKGLEFPVVFLPDLAHQFRLASQGEWMLLDSALGLALRKVDRAKHMTHHTFQGKAIQLKKAREVRSEEARLLYVAMTRARERLILLGAPSNIDTARKVWSRAGGEYAATTAGRMMDWVGAALWPALEPETDTDWTSPGGARIAVRYRAAGSLRLPAPEEEEHAPVIPFTPPGPEVIARLQPLAHKPSHPLKLSVTQLARQLQEIAEESPPIKRRALEEEAAHMLPLTREESMERGISTHRVLGTLSLEALRGKEGDALQQALMEELDRLQAAGMLMPAEKETVNVLWLQRFFAGDLGQRLLRAREVQREWPFSLLVEEGLVLQGVLDCCFMEDGAWVLIDYKTDRAGTDTLLERYRDQMRWYMRALRDITDMPVQGACLYALRTGETAAVAEHSPIRFEAP